MTSHEPLDGVIKFSAEHRRESLSVRQFAEMVGSLQAWRHIFFRLNFIGQDPSRYDGAGFGNVSARIPPHTGMKGKRKFIVTGTQTGARPHLGLRDYCVVESYDIRLNRVVSFGETMPSSESMTHGAIYDLNPAIRFVFHGHIPVIWRQAQALRLPTSRKEVPYGTTEMASEVARLYRETSLSDRRVLAMGGHEDGIISFGKNADEAGSALVSTLSQALQLESMPSVL